jgi:D-alanyl-D-alanine carboxypeptidase (penicillin-binding protein 5/6)
MAVNNFEDYRRNRERHEKSLVEQGQMVYKRGMVILLLAILFLLPLPSAAYETITASSFLLVEKDSFQIISGRDYHRRLPPASTTKVLTALLAVEGLSGDEVITADGTVRRIPPSKLNLVPGQRYKASDLMRGTLLESANDAAYTLGKHLGGTEEGFAGAMTRRAREVGAHNTLFRNASGLSVHDQYTTCYDLALIFRHALENDRFRQIASMRYFSFQNGTKTVTYKNHNRFLFCFEPAIGGKTGFTRAARHCYVGAFEKDGKVYILSLLGSRNLWGDAVAILGNVFDRLPSDQEIKAARANSVLVAAHKQKKVKKFTSKKKPKRQKELAKRHRRVDAV